MYKLELTEKEIATLLCALSHYQNNNPHITQEQFDIAENINQKIDEIL